MHNQILKNTHQTRKSAPTNSHYDEASKFRKLWNMPALSVVRNAWGLSADNVSKEAQLGLEILGRCGELENLGISQ